MSVSYQSIITLEPGKRGGKPCIRGMRITVYDVLSYLAAGMTPDEILADFPYLTFGPASVMRRIARSKCWSRMHEVAL